MHTIGCITLKDTHNSIIILFILGLFGILSSCQTDPAAEEEADVAIPLVPLVEEFDESEQKWGFIDKKGKVVISGAYDELGNFSEDLASFRKKAKWGYLNKSGIEIIPPQYYNAFAFKKGKAKVSNFERKYGIINTQGKSVIPIQYDGLGDFSEGMCAFKKDGKWGYINEENTVKIKADFDSANDFKNNQAIVKKKDKYFLINKVGKKISEDFDKLSLMDSGLYKVRLNKKYGILAKTGKSLVEAKYQSISDASGQVVAVKKDGKFSLLSLPETDIEIPENDNIGYLSEGRWSYDCLLYTSPSPRDRTRSRMPSSA